jgi:catechol 2,3-dioxygenase-like lactoylglutathione lyase family enzyme
MSALHPFRRAFPVHDLDAARIFYGDVLGRAEDSLEIKAFADITQLFAK